MPTASQRCVLLAFTFAAACTTLPHRAAEQPALRARPPLAIRNVVVVNVTDGTLDSGQTVITDGDRIQRIGPMATTPTPAGATVVDAAGRYLIPGLWDMHTHSLNQWRWTFPLHVANGVTGIRDLSTSVPMKELRRVRADVDAGSVTGPRFVTAGPLLDGPESQRGYLSVHTADEARAAVDSLQGEGVDFIKVYHGLSRAAFQAVMDAAGRHGLPVVGHIPEALDDPMEAISAGMRSIEHVSQFHLLCAAERAEIMRLVSQSDSIRARGDARRADEMVQRAGEMRFTSYRAPFCEEVGRTMAARGTWITPTLTLELQTYQPPVEVSTEQLFARPEYQYMPRATLDAWRRRHVAAIADTSRAHREEAQELRRQSLAKVADMHRGGAGMLAGTDGSGSFQVYGFNLHEELGWLVLAGLTPLEALQSATRDPARFLGRETEVGSVTIGKRADLVLLDADPLQDIANTRRIHAVVLGGRLLRRDVLDALLSGVAAFHASDGR
ncbi:MAG: amidohydrolase family protein [Gemmatimonadota bacterium]